MSYRTDPNYDEDWSQIEWYISITKGESADPLYDYYKGIAKKYWIALANFLKNMKPSFQYDRFYYHTPQPYLSDQLNFIITSDSDQEIELNSEDKKLLKILYSDDMYSKQKYIVSNISYYENVFRKMIDEMEGEVYQLKLILAPFILMGSLACLNIFPPLEINDTIIEKMGFGRNTNNYFILVNETGQFTLNTYLYALFNNVKLVGIPSGEESFDGTYGCPITFMRHDMSHTGLINGHVFGFMKPGDYLENVYFPMLDKADNIELKKLLIFSLWYAIHESYTPIFDKNDQNRNLEHIGNIIKVLVKQYPPFVDESRRMIGIIDENDFKAIKGLWVGLHQKKKPIVELIRELIKAKSNSVYNSDMVMCCYVITYGLVWIGDNVYGFNLLQYGYNKYSKITVKI